MTLSIDLNHIESLGGLASPDLVEILQDFLNDLETQTEIFSRALEKNDRDAFREQSHSLKGSALMSGFPEIGKLAADWESIATTDAPLPDPHELSASLTEATVAARSAFAEALARAR